LDGGRRRHRKGCGSDQGQACLDVLQLRTFRVQLASGVLVPAVIRLSMTRVDGFASAVGTKEPYGILALRLACCRIDSTANAHCLQRVVT
jgi:hypothetical protein